MGLAMKKDNMTFKGILLEHEPMSRHTSWRVGGVAACFYRPADISDLSLSLKNLNSNELVFWLGLGSNLLVTASVICGQVR